MGNKKVKWLFALGFGGVLGIVYLNRKSKMITDDSEKSRGAQPHFVVNRLYVSKINSRVVWAMMVNGERATVKDTQSGKFIDLKRNDFLNWIQIPSEDVKESDITDSMITEAKKYAHLRRNNE